jgi:hypothetical protein
LELNWILNTLLHLTGIRSPAAPVTTQQQQQLIVNNNDRDNNEDNKGKTKSKSKVKKKEGKSCKLMVLGSSLILRVQTPI